MSRILRVAAAQMGPTQRADTAADTLDRILALLEQAAAAAPGWWCSPNSPSPPSSRAGC